MKRKKAIPEGFKNWRKPLSAEETAQGARQLAAEATAYAPGYTVTMFFSHGCHMLGTIWGFDGFRQSSFRLASV